MSKFDLTRQICQYFNPTLTFPLFEFLTTRTVYTKESLLKQFLHCNSKTNTTDYNIDLRQRLQHGTEVPEELVQKKIKVLEALNALKAEAAPVTQIMDAMTLNNTEKNSDDTIAEIQSSPEGPHMLDIAYKLAKALYECGRHDESYSYLYFCFVVMSPNDKNYSNVLWGLLSCDILHLNWSGTMDYLNRLREIIDSGNYSTIQALQQRTWLIHWSLFTYFHLPKGLDLIIEMFLYKPLYLNTIQTMCPHILRYMSVAVIINTGRRNALKDLIKVIQQESFTYRDPITEFLEHLYINFDFEGARLKLQECQSVINNDFFIYEKLNEFNENARLMIFETFCRIHQCITIDMLADKLNMDPEEAECWIVNLIRSARLDAKIDSKLGHVVMNTQPLSPYQQLIEKIDSLSVRSEALTSLVERKHKAKNIDAGESTWKYY